MTWDGDFFVALIGKWFIWQSYSLGQDYFGLALPHLKGQPGTL